MIYETVIYRNYDYDQDIAKHINNNGWYVMNMWFPPSVNPMSGSNFYNDVVVIVTYMKTYNEH